VADAVSAASDSAEKSSGRIGGKITGLTQRAGDTVSGVTQATGTAISTTVDTTKYLTAETSRILFWLSMLGSLILLVFIPDRDRQREIWHNLQQFVDELRQMWSDFSDEDFAQEEAQDAEVSAEA